MNGLLAAMAVANPVITALLTIVVFLEKDKLRKRSEDIEAALKNGNASVVQTIEAQKQDFTNIADRLEALSKDSEKSAATFIGLSTALTESSAVSAKALGGVTEGLQRHASAMGELVADLATRVSKTSAVAISDLSNKTTETVEKIREQVGKSETIHSDNIKTMNEEIARVVQEIEKTNNSIRALQETLKSAITI